MARFLGKTPGGVVSRRGSVFRHLAINWKKGAGVRADGGTKRRTPSPPPYCHWGNAKNSPLYNGPNKPKNLIFDSNERYVSRILHKSIIRLHYTQCHI